MGTSTPNNSTRFSPNSMARTLTKSLPKVWASWLPFLLAVLPLLLLVLLPLVAMMPLLLRRRRKNLKKNPTLIWALTCLDKNHDKFEMIVFNDEKEKKINDFFSYFS